MAEERVFFDEDDFIISKTNPNGIITYVNRLFLQTSGYEEFEVLGKPHNIIRHPDMPKEAFRDLWETVKSGKEWNGIVKNYCKNKDYYWVDAIVSPSFSAEGEIIGFMSVRRAPSDTQVNEATKLYAKLKKGE